LRGIFVVAAPKGPHSSAFTRLASGAFFKAIGLGAFYEIINFVAKKIKIKVCPVEKGFRDFKKNSVHSFLQGTWDQAKTSDGFSESL